MRLVLDQDRDEVRHAGAVEAVELLVHDGGDAFGRDGGKPLGESADDGIDGRSVVRAHL